MEKALVNAPMMSECCSSPIEVETYMGNKHYNVCTGCGTSFCKVKPMEKTVYITTETGMKKAVLLKGEDRQTIEISYDAIPEEVDIADESESLVGTPTTHHISFWREIHGVNFILEWVRDEKTLTTELVIHGHLLGASMLVKVPQEAWIKVGLQNAVDELQSEIAYKIIEEHCQRAYKAGKGFNVTTEPSIIGGPPAKTPFWKKAKEDPYATKASMSSSPF